MPDHPTEASDSGVEPRTEVSPDEGVCEVEAVNAAAVQAALRSRAADEDVDRLAEMFAILGSPTRLRLLEALAERELCVCDLAAVAGVSQSAVSHHLRLLRQLRMVSFRKEGRMAYYRLNDEHVVEIIDSGLSHARE